MLVIYQRFKKKKVLYICKYKMILFIPLACQSTPWGGYKDLGHNEESVTFTVNLNELITPQAEF